MTQYVVDIAEINIMGHIVQRLKEAGLTSTAARLEDLIHYDLMPLCQWALPSEAGEGGKTPALIEAKCVVEGCQSDPRTLFNMIRGVPPVWVCRDHIPSGEIRPGFPHPAMRDSMIVDAWRNFFKREDPAGRKP